MNIFPYKKAPYDLGACLHYHLSLLFPAAISPPPEIINQSNDSRRKADAEIHEGVAQDVHRKAQDGSCKAYGNILGPEIGGRGHACPGGRRALDGQGLEAWRKGAEADAQKGRRYGKQHRSIPQGKEDEAQGEEDKSRVNNRIRSMMVIEVPY